MARRIPEDRFEALVRGATEVFIAHGYRLTQMSDVASAVGVAKGTLYGYVESKDALLVLCLQHADDEGPITVPEALPIPTLPPGQLAEQVKAALAVGAQQPRLEAALDPARAETSGMDPSEEIRAIFGELYDLMRANRHGIKLLDRCADHPELSDVWQAHGREQPRLAMARFIEDRIARGQMRPVANLRLAARLVIETCTTWAVHIHWDRSPEAFDPEEARANAIDFLVRALVAKPAP
jgi:AcrR family transcriptional regulator